MSFAALVFALVVESVPGHCYVITNRRIVLLPSCDFSPSSIAEVMKSEPQTQATRGAPTGAPYQVPMYATPSEGTYGRAAPRRW